MPEKQNKINFEAKIMLDASRKKVHTLMAENLFPRTKRSRLRTEIKIKSMLAFIKVLLFALKKTQFYRIIAVPDCNNKRSKTPLIYEGNEK